MKPLEPTNFLPTPTPEQKEQFEKQLSKITSEAKERAKEISKAIKFVEEKHGGQMYGDESYRYHLMEVFCFCTLYRLSKEGRIIGLLHDVLEDTDTQPSEIEAMFGPSVLEGVLLLTGVGESRKEKMASLKQRLLASTNLEAIQVKIIDRYVNVKHAVKTANQKILSMYAKEHADFMEIVNYARTLDELNNVPSSIYNKYEQEASKFFK